MGERKIQPYDHHQEEKDENEGKCPYAEAGNTFLGKTTFDRGYVWKDKGIIELYNKCDKNSSLVFPLRIGQYFVDGKTPSHNLILENMFFTMRL